MLRLEVLHRRRQLDRALAAGIDPGVDPALALRARQLTRPSAVKAVAGTLGNLLDAAEEPPTAWPLDGPRPPLERESVLAARNDLVELADRLCGPREVSAQAAALAALLVWDSDSPVYTDATQATVAEIVRAALAC